ncbi:MAG: sel1 repeat family protein [Treponema sp.]|jgi:hypothetical protein|nr:sel1 repeat family protein [Treponema sp.]
MQKNRVCSWAIGAAIAALVMGFVLAGCASKPVAVEAGGAASKADKAGYASSGLVGKWLSLSTGYVDELILSEDESGSSTLFKGSGAAERTLKLTFNPKSDSFSMEVPGTAKKAPVKYARSEDGTRLTVYFMETQEVVYAKEEQVIKEVSEGEDLTSILRLGNYYSVAGDAKCVALFTEAVKRGSPDGNLNLGNHYYNTDKAKAFEYYLAAAEQGMPQAEFNVFVFYLNGEGGIAKDEAKAVDWLLKADEHGSADADRVMKQFGFK